MRVLTEGVYSTSEHRQKFQENIIFICKSILGQNTPSDIINNLTMNQIWNIIFGVDFGNRKIKDDKLSKFAEIPKKEFKKFYKEFEVVANDFCDESYVHSNPLKNRRFSIAGSYLYWIPFEDLPGCSVK